MATELRRHGTECFHTRRGTVKGRRGPCRMFIIVIQKLLYHPFEYYYVVIHQWYVSVLERHKARVPRFSLIT